MKNPFELLGILDHFMRVKVLVVGDVMLDRYWLGSASRLSPEAPVPVVALQKVTNLPGGAANVAANIAGFGAEVFLTGVVGSDDSANCLGAALAQMKISSDFLYVSNLRQTTTKTRVLVHNQQIARIDDETKTPLSITDEKALFARIRDLIPQVGVIILSDYAKGCLTETLIGQIADAARQSGKIVLVDPKSRDFSKYNGATILTPNLSEALAAAGLEQTNEEMAEPAARKIMSETAIEALLITLGEHGMKLFRRNGEMIHFPSVARQVFDVTGAGDTVIASLAVSLAAGADAYSAISLANVAAGLAVEKVGTSIIPLEELRAALENDFSHLTQTQ